MKDVTQTGRVMALFCLLAGGIIVLPALATDDMPEVLRYARQYSRANPESMKHLAGEKEGGDVVDAKVGLSRKLARSELIRRQQQVQLKILEGKLRESEAALAAARHPSASTPEKRGVRQQDIKTMTSRIEELSRDLRVATDKQTALTNQIRDLQREKDALQMKADVDTSVQQAARQKAEIALKATSEELTSRTTELTAARRQADTLVAEKMMLEKTVQTLRQQNKTQKTEKQVSLKTASQRRAYAAGVIYARDVQEALDGNRLLGVSLDSAAMMAGLNDALSGQSLQLKEDALAVAGHDLEKVTAEGFRSVTEGQKKQAETWLKNFRKGKGVSRDDTGFWYQITYEGDGDRLKPDDTIDVVVEESLINGKVVSDMDRAGNSLRQKVREFPPVFAAGLARLKNHGQITLVVPPELAYGDKGYPPDVPPGATMIYRVRVADRIAESESPPSAPEVQNSKETSVGRRAG
ncbi:FKBP-type peptidyl-prolyl cis-trans isomerase [Salmonella enterica]|nr:FKBP-type peptidyl-prolyl cis-trans isomerase [Salmonella enterica]